MTTYKDAIGTALRRTLSAAALAAAILGLAGTGDAAAQAVVRFDPNSITFPPAPGIGTVDVYADNVTDLQGFKLVISYDQGILSWNESDPTYYVTDPNLVAAWGSVNVSTSTDIFNSTLTWQVTAQVPTTPVNGTVRLGRLRFNIVDLTGNGILGWDFSTVFSEGTPTGFGTFPTGQDASFTVGTASSDLSISCTQTSPADPNLFVDGDVVSLNCNVSNAGPLATVGNVSVAAVISGDTTVNSGDALVATGTVVGSIAAGASRPITLSGNPSVTIPGNYFLLAKADVDPGNLNLQNGLINETNETNNVQSRPVQVLFPVRNLTIPTASVTPDPIDPNAIHAGSFFQVAYTLTNAGNAVIRSHTNRVRLSTDAVLDPNDPTICSLAEPPVPGILGGQSRSRTYGFAGSTPTCQIAISQTPGSYFIIFQGDANNDVIEQDPNGASLENDNTNAVPVTIAGPLPSQLVPAPAANVSDTRAEITAPGKGDAFFSIVSVFDFASYQFTLTWAPANLIEIQDPNTDVVFSTVLEGSGRTQSCAMTGLNNAAGTATFGCTTTGAGAGVTVPGAADLVRVAFRGLVGGTGTMTLSGAAAATSTGSPISLQILGGTFEVGGLYNLDVENPVLPAEAYPGNVFTTSYDLCNSGFSDSPGGVRLDVILSRDAVIDPNAGDSILCGLTESTAIVPGACVSRSLTTCDITTDLRPGDYTLAFRIAADADPPHTEPLPLPSRVFAIREGGKRTLESTGAPDGVNGAVTAVLGSDTSFKAKSIGSIGSTARNLNFLTSWVKPDKGRRVDMLRTPNKIATDVDKPALTQLRLHSENRAILGGADVDGDGELEILVLSQDGSGEYLEFRTVDYTKRKPIVGVPAAVTEPFPSTVKVAGATGIQFDADAEDEIAVVTTDATGAQTLAIYDLVITAPPGTSTLAPLADDATFGTEADSVIAICALDDALDGTEEIAALFEASGGTQALRIFQVPATAGGETGTPIADDPAYGGTQTRPRVRAITCTR